jgi:N-acetyl-alpha-D-muramate 1-phosphate uridylyltransferase
VQVVILAGGLGTRMARFTTAMPKALIPVCGRPFIDWQLRLLASQGVGEVLLCVGHLGQAIETFVGDGQEWGLSVQYSWERGELLGTGGALRHAAERGLLAKSFAVTYGDSYLDVNLDRVGMAFADSGRPGLMTVYRNDGRFDRSNADLVDGQVFYDKAAAGDPRLRYVDYGLSMLSRDELVRRVPALGPSDLAEFLHSLSAEGQLAGYLVERRFYEIGSEAGLADLEAYLCGRRPPRKDEPEPSRGSEQAAGAEPADKR